MDFRDRHVVVTGGTGGLGRAVVGAWLAAGAHCHVPYRQEREKQGLPTGALSLIPTLSLADEAAVVKLYGGLPSLWASINIAGGFAFAPLTDTSGELMRRLIDDNLVSCFLCCREAVAAMRRGKAGGRVLNPAGRQARRRRALRSAGRGAGGRGNPGERRGALDHGYPHQPARHAQGQFRCVAQGGGGGDDDPLPRLAREQGESGRRGPGLRGLLPIGGDVIAPAESAMTTSRRVTRLEYPKRGRRCGSCVRTMTRRAARPINRPHPSLASTAARRP